MFAIIEVAEESADLPEQLGTKFKFWFRNLSGDRCLFKEGRPNTGENWAEKVAAELCGLLGLPAARYELGRFRDKRGVISPTFVPRSGRLILGNELLAKILKDYDENKRYRVREYKLRTVLIVLGAKSVNPPIGFQIFEGVESAVDVFVGYLMLDALIANQDRHHENWGLILTADRVVHLAPTYDHASSLGRNELDTNRLEMLTTKDIGRSIEKYIERAASAFYPLSPADPDGRVKPMSTLEAFKSSAHHRPAAGKAWIKRLDAIAFNQIEKIFTEFPAGEISPVAVEFSLKMLKLNKARLLSSFENL